MSFTAPCQSRPSIKCCASATSNPTFPLYKLICKEKKRIRNRHQYWYRTRKDISISMKYQAGFTFLYCFLLWDQCFITRIKLRNLLSMIFYLKINTPPFLKHDNSRSIVFPDYVCVKCLLNHQEKRGREREREVNSLIMKFFAKLM